MNLHEHQAKALLRNYGIPMTDGVNVETPAEAALAAESLPRGGVVAPSFAVEGEGLRLTVAARGEGCALKPDVAAALARRGVGRTGALGARTG